MTQAGALEDLPAAEGGAAENMAQLVALRWIAVTGQVATILFVRLAMGVPLPVLPMLAVCAIAAAINLQTRRQVARGAAFGEVNLLLALMFDVATFSVLLVFSGGASNPFVWLYLLQVVLGAVLLKPWSAWALVATVASAFALLSAAREPLRFPRALAPHARDLLLTGDWLCFALVAVLVVTFVTRITHNLQAHERHVADLRQQAAEEDGIVRMGLLASGAAHELGSPLASVSVILGDWKRMPRLAHDPELMAEIATMEAEVGRCKAIVTTVLAAAGEPRGQAPAPVEASRFLAELASDWRGAHPATPLAVEDRLAAALPIVADPALRQAVTSILDNAAEASPSWVGLEMWRAGDDLLIRVRDRGAGFPPALIASIGRPLRSAKGEGRGVGLFLAANVARKLGGTLRAENGSGGGAVLTLSLPLAMLSFAGGPE